MFRQLIRIHLNHHIPAPIHLLPIRRITGIHPVRQLPRIRNPILIRIHRRFRRLHLPNPARLPPSPVPPPPPAAFPPQPPPASASPLIIFPSAPRLASSENTRVSPASRCSEPPAPAATILYASSADTVVTAIGGAFASTAH